MSNFWFDYQYSLYLQKHPLRGVRRERCTENVQQIYGEHARRSAISVKLQSGFIEITLQHGCSPVNLLHLQSGFIEITLQHGCSPVNLLHIFRTIFPKNASGGLLLNILHLLCVHCNCTC